MKKQYLIWDLPLRIFHWSFASTLLLLWLTSELGTDYIDWHIKLGYLILVLTSFRIIWGFIGPKHARFSQFIPSPRTVIRYLKTHKLTDAEVYAGHNPIGSIMVLLMLLLVLLQATSGLFVDDEVFTSGPYFNAAGDSIDKIMRTIHLNTFDFILAAIALHITAIIFYKKVKKQNLAKAMITGKKDAEKLSAEDEISSSRLWLALIVVSLCIAFVYWLVVINPPPMEEFFY